jgi:hypothetical protein
LQVPIKGGKYDFLKLINARAKPVIISEILTRMHITGVYSFFTGEANINIMVHGSTLPAILAHEHAHHLGIFSEDEANFVAILACDLSGNDVYRYSGHLFAYNHLARALSRVDHDGYLEIEKSLPEDVRADLRFHRDYWKQFDTWVSDVSDSIHDDYLKNQGQELGTKSYGAVVYLLVAYYLE